VLLYRYLPACYALDALQTGLWKVGRTAELNDPADFRPYAVPLDETDSGRTFAKESGDRMMESFAKLWGVLSFSETIEDPVVWSHYADSHRGIALGFELDENDPYLLFQVTYSTEVAELDVMEFAQAQSTSEPSTVVRVLRGAFGRKFASWSYEREWRALVRLDRRDCHPKGTMLFIPLPTQKLSSVLLGMRCPLHPVDVYRSLRQYPNGDEIEIAQMETVAKSYLLKKTPYDVRPLPCDGNDVRPLLKNVSDRIARARESRSRV